MQLPTRANERGTLLVMGERVRGHNIELEESQASGRNQGNY